MQLRHARRSARPRRRSRSTVAALLGPGVIGLAVACGVTVGMPAAAQAPTKDEQPVLLTADSVTFDEQNDLVTARGNVELSQGARIVKADTITYNRRTKVVTATSNVRLVEPSGEIVFADYAELTDDMRDAFVSNIKMLMTDNGRMVGNEGERRDERLMRINRGVYSPCELCKDNPEHAPLWQIRAVRVVHDREEKQIRYRDAVLELFGIPVAYTPYLSHPDPTVDRRSGFLSPVFGHSSDLGYFLRNYYYFDIAPDQDATVEVTKFGRESVLVGGEYRQRFEKGTLQLAGSLIHGDLQSADDTFKREEWRGRIAGRGLFDIDDTWRWGFTGERATDRKFLRRYYDRRDEVLTSRAFIEGFNGRNYAVANAYSFQDLRYGSTVQQPLVAPDGLYRAFGEPGGLLGGRWSLETGVLSLLRTDGTDTRRFYVQPSWRRDIISSLGFVTTLNASVLASVHHANDYDRPDTTTVENDTSTRYRFFPSADLTVRYPFVRNGENSQQFIEPIGQVRVASNLDNDARVPNEDSLDVEFDESNLFMPNRFTGIDRLEGGTRVTYGVRAGIYGNKQGSATIFVGQSHRFTDQSDYPTGSGLDTQVSDYVGRINLSPANWFDANYGFRLDHDSLSPRRHSLNLSAGIPEFRPYITYTYSNEQIDKSAGTQSEVEQATIGFSSRINDYWSLTTAHQQAFYPDPGARTTLAILSYHDECFTFDTVMRRDFTDEQGVDNTGTTVFFRLVFKNIGEFILPSLSTGMFGSGSTSQAK